LIGSIRLGFRVSASSAHDKIVELFADKIPHTHGAPVRATVGRQAM